MKRFSMRRPSGQGMTEYIVVVAVVAVAAIGVYSLLG
ncbi:MAG: pilus assembly protein, partial [Burkholderiaceae bacterium]